MCCDAHHKNRRRRGAAASARILKSNGARYKCASSSSQVCITAVAGVHHRRRRWASPAWAQVPKYSGAPSSVNIIKISILISLLSSEMILHIRFNYSRYYFVDGEFVSSPWIPHTK